MKAAYKPERAAVPDAIALRMLRDKILEDNAQEVARSRKRIALSIIRARRRMLTRIRQIKAAARDQAQLERTIDIAHVRQSVVRSSLQGCLDVALCVTEELLKESFLTNQAALIRRIEDGLQQLLRRDAIEIVVHPVQLTGISDAFAHLERQGTLRITADKNISPGKARLRVPSGEIELDWELHFASLRQQLSTSLQVMPLENFYLEENPCTQSPHCATKSDRDCRCACAAG